MKSLHLRLDIGIGNEESLHPKFVIAYNQKTSFADVLRNVFEMHFLGGHLLDFLQYNSQTVDGQERKELHVLAYSKVDATLLRSFWSHYGETNVHNRKQRLFLQLSYSSGGQAKTIDPSTLVISFVDEHSWEIQNGGGDTNWFDMKLVTKLACEENNELKNVNILLCEEDWRKGFKGKLLEGKTFLFTKKAPAAPIITSSKEQYYPTLKSFLIPNFLGSNQMLIAMAFLVPTSLILRGVDTLDGVKVSVDKPSYCQSRSLNLERPAVLRQYFGKDSDDSRSLSSATREGAVLRKVYGSESGAQSVGIHPEHFTTREMTVPMVMIADEIFRYLKARFGKDDKVCIRRFDHMTLMLYYQKGDNKNLNVTMLGYHTDNVYSHDGSFKRKSNSQKRNTFTAVLTLGDDRTLNFRRQERPHQKSKEWISEENTLPFSLKHGSLFLLHPHDERPTQVNPPNGPTQRFQHGGVKFPHPDALSVALVFRTVTCTKLVNRNTGRPFSELLPRMLPLESRSDSDVKSNNVIASGYVKDPEVTFMLKRFRGETAAAREDCTSSQLKRRKTTTILDADMKLKRLWHSTCERNFQYRLDGRLSHSPSMIHRHISDRLTDCFVYESRALGNWLSSHPYYQLLQACNSRSQVKKQLVNCFSRTQLPLDPSIDDTVAHWLIDWEPIVRMLQWDKAFSNYDSVVSPQVNSSTRSMLSNICHAIKKLASREHNRRLKQLHVYYKVNSSKSSVEQAYSCNWGKMIHLFDESQLLSLQRIILDVWMENRRSISGLLESDLFMSQFILEPMTSTLVDRRVIRKKLIHQYTTSLCCDINAMVHPSKLNPVERILYGRTKFVTGTDGHTRFLMFRILISTVRRWVEYLVGLQGEKCDRDLQALFEDGCGKGCSVSILNDQTMHANAALRIKDATMTTLTTVVNDCKEQDTRADPFNLETPVTDAINSLFNVMKNVGALRMLTQEQQRLHLADPSNLNSIRLIDDTLQLDVDSLAKIEEEAESTVSIDSSEAVLRCLVFPYLHYSDLVQPICKLWTRLAGCNLLWKSLYHSQFGAAPPRWSMGVKEHDWKLHFRYALSTSKQ